MGFCPSVEFVGLYIVRDPYLLGLAFAALEFAA
jgi:hypothetical protein